MIYVHASVDIGTFEDNMYGALVVMLSSVMGRAGCG